jgi:hypothetical protein
MHFYTAALHLYCSNAKMTVNHNCGSAIRVGHHYAGNNLLLISNSALLFYAIKTSVFLIKRYGSQGNQKKPLLTRISFWHLVPSLIDGQLTTFIKSQAVVIISGAHDFARDAYYNEQQFTYTRYRYAGCSSVEYKSYIHAPLLWCWCIYIYNIYIYVHMDV